MFSPEMISRRPLARPPGGAACCPNVRPQVAEAQDLRRAPHHQGQQGFNYRPQPHTQVDSQLVVCAIVELHHQQLFIPGRPPGPTQSAWSVVRVSIPQELGSTLRLTC